MSTSFDYTCQFDDADGETMEVRVPLYSEHEFLQVIQFKQLLKLLPKMDKKQRERLAYETGHVPRMLFFFCLIFNRDKSVEFDAVLQVNYALFEYVTLLFFLFVLVLCVLLYVYCYFYFFCSHVAFADNEGKRSGYVQKKTK